jgi:hypothetical protein
MSSMSLPFDRDDDRRTIDHPTPAPRGEATGFVR